jgi:prepilin-type processing-associated H-X9-DG protein
MMGYANQCDMQIVPLGNWPSMVPFFRGWHFTLEPHLRDMKVMACPAMSKFDVGYGQNYRVIGGCSELLSLYRYAQPLNLVRKPSQSFIFCDWGWISNPDAPANDWVRGISPHTDAVNRERSYARMPLDVLRPGSKRYYVSYETTPYRAFPAHPGYKSNCSFFDGHIKGYPTWDIVDDEYGERACLYDNQ